MKIFLTLLSTDSYLKYVLTLYQSYLHTNSKYPFYIGVGKLVSKKIKEILKLKNIPFIEIIDTYNTSKKWFIHNQKEGHNNWNYVWEKIEFIKWTQFDKICCLDADMIILKNIDHLLELPNNFYVTPMWPQEVKQKTSIFHTGTMIFKPDINLYNKMITNLQNKKEQYENESFVFLDTLKNFEFLKPEYNVLNYWLGNKIYFDLNNTYIFHFDDIKPDDKRLSTEYMFLNKLILSEKSKYFYTLWQKYYEEWHGKEKK